MISNMQKQRVKWWFPVVWRWGKQGDVGQRVQSCTMTKSGDLVYSMMAAVNNTGLNTGNLLRG